MTEDEWLTSEHPWPMFQFLEKWEHQDLARPVARFISRLRGGVEPRPRLSPRLLYLSACGPKRLLPHRLGVLGDAEVFGIGVFTEEQFADGEITLEQLLADDPRRRWHWPNPWHLVSNVIRHGYLKDGHAGVLMAVMARVFRDIFGNPFRPVAVDPGWLTSDVVGLARTVYDVKAFDRLPVLADALQDAGCNHADVLAHCRGGGPHVRGCWVVDLVLGKT